MKIAFEDGHVAEIEVFFHTVMDDLRYGDWTLNWMPSDAYCWRRDKIIDICPMDSVSECKQMLLHEIAHIKIVEPLGCQHTFGFWAHLEELIRKYLHSRLGPHQKEMAEWYCPEFGAA